MNSKEMEDYAQQAKDAWGETDAYKEFEQRSAGRTAEDQQARGSEMMQIFARFGELKAGRPESPEAIALAKQLQDYITQNFYTCTDNIFASLGQSYTAGDKLTENIDAAGGPGTAEFANQAIQAYLSKK